MTVHLDEVNENLLPRRYQEEIFSRAQENQKVIVFLVPKVALVEQQGDFIAKETSLRVSKCYGATAIDLADRRGWRKEIQNHDVLVMTAQRMNISLSS